MVNNSIPDDDGSLRTALREIVDLQHSLKVAEEDAMKLSSKIVNLCKRDDA